MFASQALLLFASSLSWLQKSEERFRLVHNDEVNLQ